MDMTKAKANHLAKLIADLRKIEKPTLEQYEAVGKEIRKAVGG